MKVGVLHLHGMGQNKDNSHVEMIEEVTELVQKNIELTVNPVKYYKEMGVNQDSLMKRFGSIGLKTLRYFMITSLGDVGTMGFNTEPYEETISTIRRELCDLKDKIGPEAPIVVIAHSLGAQMFSCFLWDEEKRGITYPQIELLITTGNNIPLFISGLPEDKIKPFSKPCCEFKWVNFWCKNDILGYPMKPLSKAYDELVEDVKVFSWMPIMSHALYKKKKKVLKRISSEILKLVK